MHVDEGHDHPGPGSAASAVGVGVGRRVGEAGGELLDMTAQLGQRLIGEPNGAAMQIDLPAVAGLPGLAGGGDVHRGGLQHRPEEGRGLLRVGVAGGRLGPHGRVDPFDLAPRERPIFDDLNQLGLL